MEENLMDIVALRFDRNKRFTIQQFEQMDEMERDSYKKNIVCDECSGDAYYRSAAKDGKTACFGATHLEGCDTASKGKKTSAEGDEEANEVEMSSDFDITWNYVNKSAKLIDTHEENIDGKIEINRKKYMAKPSIERKSKIGLNTILKCAEYEMIKEQNYFVNIPENGQKLLKDVVVRLEEIDDKCLNKNLFMWGKIHRFTDTWINTQYANNVSIRINDNIKEKFWDIYKGKIIKLLLDKNCLIIIFGKAKKSGKGNYYISLNDIKYFYVKKIKSKSNY